MHLKLDEFLKNLRRHHRIRNLYTLGAIKCFKLWDRLLSKVFKYSSRCYYRQSPLEIKKVRNPSKELQYFSDHFGRFSNSKTLIGKVTTDPQDILIAEKLLLSCFDQVKNSEACELATAEILAKVVAYRQMEKGSTLWIPTLDKNLDIQLVSYEVQMIFDLWHNHVAFGLYPIDSSFAEPILLYRGTDFSLLTEGGRASIISDLDPEGPGRSLFHNSHSDIKEWLQKLFSLGRHPRAIGHSLGGVLAIYTLLYEQKYMSYLPHACSYAFNPPGISEELLLEWKDLRLQKSPFIKVFVTRGDVVSKFGYLLADVYELSTDHPLTAVIAHEQLIFSQPVSYIVQVDNDKENECPSRRYYSMLQKQGTSFAFKFGLKFLFPDHTKPLNKPLDPRK